MRVAVVAPYFPPHLGGLERYAEQQARALVAAGHEVVVVTTHPGRGRLESERSGLRVVSLGVWRTLSNTPVHPAWLWRLPRLLRELRVDVVAAHAPVPGLADLAVLRAVAPVVLTYHSGSLVKGGSRVDPLLRAYERWVLPRVFRRAAALVAVSPVASSHAFGASVISPGVDVSAFVPSSPPEVPTLAYVGRLDTTSAWKGVPVLLEAFSLLDLPSARLLVVGDGDARSSLSALADELGVGDRVTWTGVLSGPALAAAYSSASVVCLPSLTESESFGMALVEAMASGRPVVGSDVGGIPFVIRDGVDGLLVPPGDAGALAAACRSLLTDPVRAAAMGAAGRQAAEERWSWAHQTARMVEVIEAAGPDAGRR